MLSDETLLHPLGIAAMVVLSLLTFAVPRRYALFPMLALICFVSAQQRVVIWTADFTLLRILIIVGWVRLLAFGELKGLRWHPIDTVMIAYIAVGTLAGLVRDPTSGGVMLRLGGTLDSAGSYFLFRGWIRNWSDVQGLATSLAVLAVPVSGAFLWESATGHNVFSVFGGVPELTVVRQGRLRCQGAFSHPILAGCFWVAATPFMLGLWWTQRSVLALLGVAAGVIIIVLTASSTPVGGLGAVILAGGLYTIRHNMRLLRWGIVGVLLALEVMMNAPVWHIMSRINMVGGSTGWHRYHLIDNWIKHWNEWWLVGTNYTGHWGHLTSDIANQYVLEGVRGGLLRFALFIAMLSLAYKSVGMLWRACQARPVYTIPAWLLGAVLFAHTMMFFAVSYFGGIDMSWYLILAVVASLSAPLYAARNTAAQAPLPSLQHARNPS